MIDRPPSAERPRRLWQRFDAAGLVTIWTVMLMLVPGNLVVGALGAAGSPAQLVGLAAGGWWLGVQFNRSRASLTPAQPVRRAMAVFVVAIVLSYLAAAVRPIEAIELRSADRGLMLALGWLGIVLLTADGVTSRQRLDSILRGLVLMAGLVALLGIVQFYSGLALVDHLSIPGLTSNQDLTSVYDRNGFTRVAGTSTHPIEFGVMLSMILPIALHYALIDQTRSRLIRWFPVVMIAIAIPVTISRSALLGVVVVLAVVFPAWPKRRRRLAYGAIVGVLLAVYVGAPGLLGTLVKLFTGGSADNSNASRTDSYQLAWDFIQKAPVFGRGVSTFLPTYRILDNQYLGLLIETGVVGLLSFVGVMVTGIVVGVRLIRRSDSPPEVRSLARSLVGSLSAAVCAYATFDGFGFQQVAGLTFFVLGCLAVLYRLRIVDEQVREGLRPPAARVLGRPGRRLRGRNTLR